MFRHTHLIILLLGSIQIYPQYIFSISNDIHIIPPSQLASLNSTLSNRFALNDLTQVEPRMHSLILQLLAYNGYTLRCSNVAIGNPLYMEVFIGKSPIDSLLSIAMFDDPGGYVLSSKEQCRVSRKAWS